MCWDNFLKYIGMASVQYAPTLLGAYGSYYSFNNNCSSEITFIFLYLNFPVCKMEVRILPLLKHRIIYFGTNFWRFLVQTLLKSRLSSGSCPVVFWMTSGWWFHNLSEVSVPMFDHPYGEKCSFLWNWSFPCCNLWLVSLVTASAHCWLMFKLSAVSPGPFLQSCSLASSSPACTYTITCVRLFCLRCRTLYLLLLICIKHFYQSFAPSCKGFSEW